MSLASGAARGACRAIEQGSPTAKRLRTRPGAHGITGALRPAGGRHGRRCALESDACGGTATNHGIASLSSRAARGLQPVACARWSKPRQGAIRRTYEKARSTDLGGDRSGVECPHGHGTDQDRQVRDENGDSAPSRRSTPRPARSRSRKRTARYVHDRRRAGHHAVRGGQGRRQGQRQVLRERRRPAEAARRGGRGERHSRHDWFRTGPAWWHQSQAA